MNGTFAVTGAGTRLEQLVLDARGTLVDSSLFGGQVPRLAFDTHLADQALTVKANGDFSGFDPAVLGGRPELAGNLSGSLNVDATLPSLAGPIDPMAVRAGGTVSLGDSRVGEIAIASALVDGQFADGTGDIRTLTVKGPEVDVNAKGRLDLRPDGSSDLEYRASVSNLETVGRMVNTEISGNLTAEGRLTGNLGSLQTKGTGAVSNLRYGSTSVLAAKTTYDVRVPDLEAARTEVTADTTATLLEVAGRQILEATARTTWQDQTLGFDANVREQRRSLAARGEVVLHPDHQEVHLQDLALTAEGVEWRTEPGSRAAIQYGGDRIGVQDVRLVSGAQRLAVDGAFGGPGDALKVQAQAVDVASVNTLMLGTQQIGGTLSANATLTGTREAPQADATFSIVNGSFREFRYQAFDGSIAYAVDGLRLDTKLSQTPDAWIAAKGFVPASLFKPADPAEAAALRADEHVPGAPGEQLDVAVTSSALSLGARGRVRAPGDEGERHAAGRRAGDWLAEGPPPGRGHRGPQRRLHGRRADEERLHRSRHAHHPRAGSGAARGVQPGGRAPAHAERVGRASPASTPDRGRPDRDQVGSVRDRRQSARRHQAEHRSANRR